MGNLNVVMINVTSRDDGLRVRRVLGRCMTASSDRGSCRGSFKRAACDRRTMSCCSLRWRRALSASPVAWAMDSPMSQPRGSCTCNSSEPMFPSGMSYGAQRRRRASSSVRSPTSWKAASWFTAFDLLPALAGGATRDHALSYSDTVLIVICPSVTWRAEAITGNLRFAKEQGAQPIEARGHAGTAVHQAADRDSLPDLAHCYLPSISPWSGKIAGVRPTVSRTRPSRHGTVRTHRAGVRRPAPRARRRGSGAGSGLAELAAR